MGAVVDRLSLTVSDVKDFLAISVATYDDEIEDLLEAAKEDADSYLNNPFEDDDGTELDIPGPVRLGVIRWIEAELPAGLGGAPAGVISEKAGDVSRTYAQADTSQAIPAPAVRLWKRYRLLPGV
jgi:hypothetical protein